MWLGGEGLPQSVEISADNRQIDEGTTEEWLAGHSRLSIHLLEESQFTLDGDEIHTLE